MWCAAIERCLQRIHDEFSGKEDQLESNFLLQDSVILNLQRACELTIDAAMHLVRIRQQINMHVVRSILADHLDDFKAFVAILIQIAT